MYVSSHNCGNETQARELMRREFGINYAGLGLYMFPTDTLLVTLQDWNGERASGVVASKGDNYRLVIYVFNAPFHETVFASTPRTAFDGRV